MFKVRKWLETRSFKYTMEEFEASLQGHLRQPLKWLGYVLGVGWLLDQAQYVISALELDVTLSKHPYILGFDNASYILWFGLLLFSLK
ncbi:hypothetical protein CYMTET_32397, partial [Cymbomonas tetramitiformis]